MSTAPYMNLVSPVLPVDRRDFELVDPTILNPNNANPLLDGEWLSLNTSAYKLERGSGTLAVPSYQVFAERGRYDTQGAQKVPVLFIGSYEAETSIYNSSGLSVNDFLVVGDVTISATTKKGLIKCPTSSGSYWIVGHVTRLPTGKVRYRTLQGGFLRVIP